MRSAQYLATGTENFKVPSVKSNNRPVYDTVSWEEICKADKNIKSGVIRYFFTGN